MRALDRKLIRDFRRLWAQSLAVALVMACGVATLILAIGTYQSLDETRSAYYQRYRFGDIFASATRAPNSLKSTIAAIDGVAAVETRIASPVILDIPGLREPATGSGDLHSREWRHRGQRRVPAPGAPARRGTRQRGRGQLELRRGASLHRRLDLRRGHQRLEDQAQHRRHRSVAGIHLRARPRRHDAGQPPLRRAVDAGAGAGAAVQSRRGVQFGQPAPAARRRRERRHRDARHPARALWRHRRLCAQGPALQRLPRQRTGPAQGHGRDHPADLPGRLGLPHQHDPVAADLAGARTDRPVEGAGLRPLRRGLALSQAGAGDRFDRHAYRHRRRQLARPRPDAPLYRVLQLPVPHLPRDARHLSGRRRHQLRRGDPGRAQSGVVCLRAAPGRRHAPAGAASLSPGARRVVRRPADLLAAHHHGAPPCLAPSGALGAHRRRHRLLGGAGRGGAGDDGFGRSHARRGLLPHRPAGRDAVLQHAAAARGGERGPEPARRDDGGALSRPSGAHLATATIRVSSSSPASRRAPT